MPEPSISTAFTLKRSRKESRFLKSPWTALEDPIGPRKTLGECSETIG